MRIRDPALTGQNKEESELIMKKITVFLLIAAMVLAMAACSKGGDIIGTWTGEYDQVTFQKDGVVLWAERGSEKGTFGSPDQMHYTVKGNKIEFDEDDMVCTFKVSGNTLTLDFDGEPIVLTKQ